MVHLYQDVSLSHCVFKQVLVLNFVFLEHFHCVELLIRHFFNQVDFTERTFSQKLVSHEHVWSYSLRGTGLEICLRSLLRDSLLFFLLRCSLLFLGK